MNLQSTIRFVSNSARHSFLSAFLFLIPVLLVLFSFARTAQAVVPAPDGGYPGSNTAEGTQALQSLTSGVWNTALGFQALYQDTSGHSNTATGLRALFTNTDGFQNTADGVLALYHNTHGAFNTAIGYQALFTNTLGQSNTAVGFRALYLNSEYPPSGGTSENTGVGSEALYNNTSGTGNVALGTRAAFNTAQNTNTAIGWLALYNNTFGDNNIALGARAGFNISSDSFNIDIGNEGIAGDAGTIRIGRSPYNTKTFIAGIRGVTTGLANAVPVVIDTAGQLGTVSSSRRFKQDIKPMDQSSDAILALKPVKFRYKSDATNTPQFGLIAEEVAQVDPNLVVRDADGQIYTVRYDAINAMLLNEFLKEHRRTEQLKKEFETTVTRQQKEIQTLTARLDEQAAQIQKVSAQVELNKTAPQIAVNE